MPRRELFRTGGFTLIEVLAVILLTGIVLGVALDFYLDLSNASNRAAHHTRDIRRATAILDRIARDFERTILVEKPSDVDPLEHPWLFVAESRYADDGSDQVKFVTRNHRPRSPDSAESDLALVAFTIHSEGDDTYRLMRWSSPRLPEGLDRDFPGPEDEGQVLLAEGLSAFEISFYGEEGETSDTWDSTTLVESGELPSAVEIRLALADPDADPYEDTGFDDFDRELFARRVQLPIRPLDLELLLDPTGGLGSGEDDDDEDDEGRDTDGDGEPDEFADADGDGEPDNTAKTLAECVNMAAAAGLDRSDPTVALLFDIVETRANDPWSSWKAQVPPALTPFIQPDCL